MMSVSGGDFTSATVTTPAGAVPDPGRPPIVTPRAGEQLREGRGRVGRRIGCRLWRAGLRARDDGVGASVVDRQGAEGTDLVLRQVPRRPRRHDPHVVEAAVVALHGAGDRGHAGGNDLIGHGLRRWCAGCVPYFSVD